MYQKTTWVTGGNDIVVVVCKEKKGIENFRLFHKSPGGVDVGFSLVDVRTPEILDYKQNKVEAHYRTYYVLDLQQNKIFRADAVRAWASFPSKANKHAIVLAEYTDADFWIEEKRGFVYCAADKKESKFWTTKRWADEEDMPGSIHVMDLVSRRVHKVPQLIFLN